MRLCTTPPTSSDSREVAIPSTSSASTFLSHSLQATASEATTDSKSLLRQLPGTPACLHGLRRFFFVFQTSTRLFIRTLIDSMHLLASVDAGAILQHLACPVDQRRSSHLVWHGTYDNIGCLRSSFVGTQRQLVDASHLHAVVSKRGIAIFLITL